MLELPPDLLGRDFDLGETSVSPEAIRRYAEMVGDEATLAAGDAMVAPPTFCLTLHRGMQPAVPLPPGCFGVYGGHDLEFLWPIHAGETYRTVARVVDVYEKSGRTGVMTIVAREASIRAANGQPAVRIHERQIVRQRPEKPPSPAAGGRSTKHRAIAVEPTSAAPGPAEIELGSELDPLLRPPTAIEQVERYVDGGEMKEALFTDAAYARSLGYSGIVVPGPMLTAFLEHFLRAALPGWHLERLGSTFRIPTITGDPISLSGVISEHHQRAGGEHIVCDLVVEHASGERAVTATARLRRSGQGVGG